MVSQDCCLTVAEVNQRLPLVRAIVRDIVTLSGDVAERRARLDDLRRSYPQSDCDSSYAEEVQQMERELARDQQRLEEFEGELQRVGGVLTCAESGTVDFATDMDGDRVWLCWRLGEPEVMFWHQYACGNDRSVLETQAASMTADPADSGFTSDNDASDS